MACNKRVLQEGTVSAAWKTRLQHKEWNSLTVCKSSPCMA